MEHDYLDDIQSFTLENLPDLDMVALAALQFFNTETLPRIDTQKHNRPLVVGSGNALYAGRIMFSAVDAVYAEEGGIAQALRRAKDIDSVYVISASGAKHAIEVARVAGESGKPSYLITSNPSAPAMEHFAPEHVFVIPHIREPYTYNTSTYLGMILATNPEPTLETLAFIEREVAPVLPEWLSKPTSFILVVPSEFEVHRKMFETKFDELFGSQRYGRAFTEEEMMHAKTIVPSPHECYIGLGTQSDTYGAEGNRIFIPVPEGCGPAAFLAIGYYVIGRIQKVNPPFFKQHIGEYAEHARTLFKQTITPIVE